MMTQTYTGRTMVTIAVLKIEDIPNRDSKWLVPREGWAHTIPPEVAAVLKVGDTLNLETQGVNTITGWFYKNAWLARRSDQELEAEREQVLTEITQRRQELLDENREQWTNDENNLPLWLRERLFTLHQEGGEYFLLNGWGYELVVAQLAEMFVRSNLEMSDEIREFDKTYGVSGNQENFARAMARKHIEDPAFSFAGTVSALTSLTGEPFYERPTPPLPAEE